MTCRTFVNRKTSKYSTLKQWIRFAEDSIEFQCRYARTVSAESVVSVSDFEQPLAGVGSLDYSMDVQAGSLGGTTNVNISANHNFDTVIPT